MILYWAKQYKDCEAELLKASSRNTTFPRTNIVLGSTYARQAQYGKAIRTLEGVSSAGSNVIGLTMLAETCGGAGEIRGVKKVWNVMQSLAPVRYVSCYAKALACKNLGETDRSLEFLEQAEEENDYWLSWQRVAPYFADFQREPRYQRVLRRIKLA
jgi:predicted Zn-dependent protease